jgi:putative SOS response-associated peptidase YedK
VWWCHMCGRFTLEPTAGFYERFEITNRLDSLTPRYNIAPGQLVPVVIAHSPNRVVLMRWGLIPHWAKEEKTAYKLLKSQRAIVPASGYYEWKVDGKSKIPYYIHPRSGSFVAFAGLYDTWTDPEGTELQTFTIVTRDAGAFMARLHHRMPVVLAQQDEQAWLDPDVTAPSQVMEILARNTGVPLDAYPVSRLVNKPSVDGKELIQPIA